MSPRVTRRDGKARGGLCQGQLPARRDLPDFDALIPAAQVWLETVANVRQHRETQRQPLDREERIHLQPVNPRPFDVGRVRRR